MEMFTQLFQPFTLVLCRLTPLFLASGMTPLAKFPAMIRLVSLLVLSISLSLITVTGWQVLASANWVFGLMSEFALGLLMLVSFQLTMAALHIVGRVLDMQIGFAAAGVVDPVSHNNDPLLGHILVLFVTLGIFLTGTHYQILSVLSETFRLVPPGSWDGAFEVTNVTAFFFSQLTLAFLILGPVILGLWLLDVFNGVVAKTMPQMNVYFVMLPLKIAVGIFMLSLSMRYVKPLLAKIYSNIVNWFELGWAI